MQRHNGHPHGIQVIAVSVLLMVFAGAGAVALALHGVFPAYRAVSGVSSGGAVPSASVSQTPASSSGTPPASSSSASTVSTPAPSSSAPSVSALRDADFAGAYFIGDSLTLDLLQATGIHTAGVFASNGMGILNLAKTTVKLDGKTLAASVEEAAPERIYILAGANDLTYIKPTVYAARYATLLDTLRKAAPQAKLYAQSVFPVTTKYASAEGVPDGTADALNQALQTLCTQKNVVYLDVASVLKDSNGALKAAYAGSGINLSTAGCEIWLEYLKAHP